MEDFGERYSNKVERAVAFAVIAHNGDKRKGTSIPYIVHPAEACAIAAGITDNEDIIAAAALHDVLEDTDYTEEDIEKHFGREVLRLVKGDSEDKSKTWQERKQATIDYIRDKADYAEKVIVLCDKLSNIRSLYINYQQVGENVWNRFNEKDKSKQAWYYASILENLTGLEETYAYKEYKNILEKLFR